MLELLVFLKMIMSDAGEDLERPGALLCVRGISCSTLRMNVINLIKL